MLAWYKIFNIITCLFLLSLQTALCAQAGRNSLSGVVKDASTGESIINANVYLSNTTIGTSTGAQGEFYLDNIPEGSYQVVIRIIGYEVKVVNLNFTGGRSRNLEIELKQKVIDLNEVVVNAESPDEWKSMLKVFEKEFIGETSNSRNCIITNPEVINLNYNVKDQVFTASTDSVIIVENKSLGYRLHIVLLSFELTSDPYVIRYKILPRFEEIKKNEPAEQKKIESNRRETYLGSFRHFLNLLRDGKIEKELYRLTQGSIYDLERKKGKYLPNDLISVNVVIDDSSLISISAPEYIGVEYLGNSGNDFSIIKINSSSIFIDKNCNLLDPYSVTCFGTFAKQRIADLLPDNYR